MAVIGLEEHAIDAPVLRWNHARGGKPISPFHKVMAGQTMAAARRVTYAISPIEGKGKPMPSGIFWRRVTVAAVALMAGSALGVGVPSLMSHSPRNSAEAATATITLRVPSIPGVGAVDVTFAKLGPITDDIQNQQSCSAGKCTSTPTPVPPTISLHDPLATGVVAYKDMLAWEQAMRAGNPAGRATATLTLTSATGTKIISYTLENAWPTNLDVLTGTPQSASFTVTLTGDLLIAS